MTAHIPEAIDNGALPSDRATQATPQAPSGLGHPVSVTSADWIEWSGGECPVAPQAIIETQMRHETPQRYDPDQCEAGSYIWSHDGGAWDIVAYRIIRP